MNLNEILMKDPASLSQEEIDYLRQNWSRLSTEEQGKFNDVVNPADSQKAMTELVQREIQDNIQKMMNKASEELLSNFKKGVEESRAKFLATGVKQGDEKANNVTRSFIKHLAKHEYSKARELTKAVTNGNGGVAPDDSEAGYLVPEELMAEVKRLQENQYGLARRDMFYLPFSGPGNERKIPTLSGSVMVYWVDEKAKIKSSKPKFSLVTQTLKKLAGAVILSNEILEDSAIDLNGLVAKLFVEAVNKEEDIQFFAGTGSPWTGVLNNTSVASVNQVSGDVNQLTADDFLDMIDKMPTSGLAGAKFYMHRSILTVVRKLKDEQGQYIFQKPTEGQPGTIWDYAYETSDAFPARADVTTGKAYVLFANLKNTTVLGDKGQLRMTVLDQATMTDDDGETIVNLAEQDLVAVRIVERVGYVITLPEAIVVLKASATVS